MRVVLAAATALACCCGRATLAFGPAPHNATRQQRGCLFAGSNVSSSRRGSICQGPTVGVEGHCKQRDGLMMGLGSKVKSLLGGAGSKVPFNKATTAPVILVSTEATADELQELAEGLQPSGVVDLGAPLRQGGIKAAEAAIRGAPGGSVLLAGADVIAQEGVEQLLGGQPLGVHVAKALEQRSSACEAATRYTLVVDDGVANARADLAALVRQARRQHPTPEDIRLDMGENTFFLSLTFPDMRPHADLLPELTDGTDAMELRVDLLSDQRPHAVLAQLQLLRRHTARLPVIFTIRSKGQCGAFVDDPVAMFDLLKWGLRGGVEYLDIEANWGWKHRARMIGLAKAHYPATVLMGSYHVVGKKTTEAQARKLYKRCYHRGQVDAVKVVTTAIEHQDSYRVHQAAESLALPVPHIGLCLTPTGSLSRVLNMRFTPVTHAKLPSVAAPGQLTSEAIMRLRQDLGILQPKQFYLFGSPISASPSPAMHNSGFQHCHLPHSYALCESEGTEAMAAALRSPDFGGGSVTIPHKQNVLQFLDQISPAAEKIGAVNTIIVQADPETGKPVLLGDNTDWLGILRPIKARLAAKGAQHKKGGVALIVGAGGAAMGGLYAMSQLGMKLVIYNRTLEKAQEVAWRFNGCAVSQLDPETFRDACGKWAPDVVISTVPGTATFTLPQHMLEAKPVVFDAAYKPARTALLDQAIKAGCPYVQGAEMLVEQGVEQFQLWTKRRAPRDVMAAAVYGSVEKL